MNNYCLGNMWESLSSEDKTRRIDFNMGEEEDIFIRSADKYLQSLEERPVENKPTQDVILHCAANMSVLVKDMFMSSKDSGSGEGRPDSLVYQLGPDAISVLTVKTLVSILVSTGEPKTFAAATAAVSAVLRLATELNVASGKHRGAWVLAEKAKKRKWNTKTLNDFVKKHSDYRIKTRQLARFTAKMIVLASRAGIVDLVNINQGRHNLPTMVMFSGDVQEALQLAAYDYLGKNKLLYRPMVVPPVAHTLECEGGVYTANLRKAVMRGSSTYWKDGEFRTSYRKSSPSEHTINALNRLMSTEWSINERVLSVMVELYHAGTGRCNLPKYDAYTGKPDFSALGLSTDEVREMYNEYFQKANDRVRMAVRISLAKQMLEFGFFYHVWTQDFRGRCYTTTELLSPQSGDQDKSLLLFANPEPQTERGVYWLKVHTANCFGMDKVSFAERVKWVDDNMDMLRAIHDDPINTLELWEDDAKKKNTSFQRLAAVFELFRTDGMTQLPVNMDGSCNGIQHWAAISRDPIIGRMVNLVNDDHPNDAYAHVAVLLSDIFEQRRSTDEWAEVFAVYWEGDIKKLRKVVKRSVMTDPYGVTREGIRLGLIADGHLDWIPQEQRQRSIAASVLAGFLVQAMDGFLRIPNQGKNWLKDAARIANEQEKHLQWTTPSGLVVKHEYFAFETIQLDIERWSKSGRRITLSFGEKDQDQVDTLGQVNGISPNYIHSLDASHMVSTINSCYDSYGIRSFSMIHDSYGVHAPHVDALRNATREEFVRLHQTNPMERVKRDFEELLGEDLPPLPTCGELDITQVLESEYFFH